MSDERAVVDKSQDEHEAEHYWNDNAADKFKPCDPFLVRDGAPSSK